MNSKTSLEIGKRCIKCQIFAIKMFSTSSDTEKNYSTDSFSIDIIASATSNSLTMNFVEGNNYFL